MVLIEDITKLLIDSKLLDSRLPCFTGNNKSAASPESRNTASVNPVTQGLRDRLQLGLTDDSCSDFVDGLINSSCNNTFTALYDSFQVGDSYFLAGSIAPEVTNHNDFRLNS